MSIWLRAVLIVTSFIACACAVSKIRKSRMRVEDAFFWFVIMGIALFSLSATLANLQCRFNELVQEMAVREYNEENQENETGLS